MIFRVYNQAVALHAAVAIRAHMRQLRRDGMAVPDGLGDLADALVTVADRNSRERELALARERMRRSRARKRGEDVPLRRPGPLPRSA